MLALLSPLLTPLRSPQVNLQHTDDIGGRGFYGTLKVRVGCGIAVRNGGEMDIDLEGGRPRIYSKADVGLAWMTGLTVDPTLEESPSEQLKDKKATVVFEVWGVEEGRKTGGDRLVGLGTVELKGVAEVRIARVGDEVPYCQSNPFLCSLRSPLIAGSH